MTIIEPQKNKRRPQNLLLFFSLFFALGAVLWSVFVYNKTVDLASNLNKAELNYKSTLTKNAELKNKLYGLLDAKNLSHSAELKGLRKYANPEYLEIKTALVLAE